MRCVLIGATALAVSTAELLLEKGHEVVIIETDEEKIDTLREFLDCGFIHGDGSRPRVLKEAGPENTDILFCLAETDQANILAALVGRSLGFERVVPKIEEEDYEEICMELGLADTIVPARETGEALAAMASGQQPTELSASFKDNVRLLSFTVESDQEGPVDDLDLPDGASVIALTREGKSVLIDSDSQIKDGDQVVILAYEENIEDLRKRFTEAEN
ncbi:MAG: TrkA family potassium uptake protein [Rhodovibrionaceae bacterium]|nr:TrkA family potassium uptake protein [Rhodovibrionaceae bacterium]